MPFGIDTTNAEFRAASAPEPEINPETNTPKLTPKGEQIFTLRAVLIGSAGAEIIRIKTTSKPEGISVGAAIRVFELTGRPWAAGNRSGVTYWAARIEAIAGKA